MRLSGHIRGNPHEEDRVITTDIRLYLSDSKAPALEALSSEGHYAFKPLIPLVITIFYPSLNNRSQSYFYPHHEYWPMKGCRLYPIASPATKSNATYVSSNPSWSRTEIKSPIKYKPEVAGLSPQIKLFSKRILRENTISSVRGQRGIASGEVNRFLSNMFSQRFWWRFFTR